jgi:vacuolar-type H+-ATPase subunit C/Vma6
MEGMFYNVKFGYLEGIVRGYRNTLLTGAAYNSMSTSYARLRLSIHELPYTYITT